MQIVASGGFNAARIEEFEAAGVPVDAYGVGSSLIRGENDYTADVVMVDAHLAGAEKAEEGVGSVDYDVWVCRCGQTQKVRYGALFTPYKTCKGCQAKTLKVDTTTLVSATTSSEGRARVDERCANCSYSNTYERSIPRVRESSSSSSSRGSSSGRGSSGSW